MTLSRQGTATERCPHASEQCQVLFVYSSVTTIGQALQTALICTLPVRAAC